MIWKSERRLLTDLKPAKYNPRRLTPKQKADLNESIEKYSLVDPLVINANGTIIGGHQRFALLVDRGDLEVDVRVPERELNEVEERELNLRLNKNTGEFDLGLLASFDPAMLVNVGFEGDFVDSIMNLNATEDEFDADKEYQSIEKANTIEGDIYEFPGGHRLMCGSSTSFDDVEKLMNRQLADLIFTDPPYNVAYKGKKGIKNDDQDPEEFVNFLRDAFTNAFACSHPHANLYCWFAMSNYGDFRSGLESAGWKYMQVIHWLKDRFALSRGWYYHRITEPCMILYKDWKLKFVNPYYAKNHDVWQMDKLTFEESLDIWYQQRDQSKDYDHPTQKPVRLGERALKKNSEVGQIVLDLFGGSGSTLVCAHQLERKAYLMELDPKYCDVIIKRYHKLTGKMPVRV